MVVITVKLYYKNTTEQNQEQQKKKNPKQKPKQWNKQERQKEKETPGSDFSFSVFLVWVFFFFLEVTGLSD